MSPTKRPTTNRLGNKIKKAAVAGSHGENSRNKTVRKLAWKTPEYRKKRGRPRKDGDRLCWRT